MKKKEKLKKKENLIDSLREFNKMSLPIDLSKNINAKQRDTDSYCLSLSGSGTEIPFTMYVIIADDCVSDILVRA